MQEKDKSTLWIIRCITALLQIKKELQKPFSNVLKEDIKLLFEWMKKKEYKASTHTKYRVILKMFYKYSYGNNEYYPDCVKWFSVEVGKEIKSKEKNLDIDEYLEEDEIVKLIDCASTIQRKAFLSCMYESGARPEEFLRLTNLDIKIDANGVILFLRGKTGERRVRVVSFVNFLQQWLDSHPLKNDKQFFIWISQATNYKNKPLGLRGANKILAETLLSIGLHNKHSRLYLLRHSRATHLCKHFTEAQMCTYFGWVIGTKVVRQYIHLTGKDLDNTLLFLSKGKQIQNEEYKLKTMKCSRCSEILSPSQKFCGCCALPISISEQYLKENEIEKENMVLKSEIGKIREDMNNKFNKIIYLIQENPKLAYIKSEILNDLL